MDQMERLEAEIGRAVEIIGQIRLERDDLKKQCETFQNTVERQQAQIEGLKSEGEKRREEMRTRVESMLARLDAVKLGEKA
ncbi:MAG: hypothetical protein EXS64_03335 [Candidatus Latescibacteria bacterium]|nr:hypothetical protein [Candidatus Latescibacterota bacterium]